MSEQKSTLLRLGGLWTNKNRAGGTYLSGRFGRIRVYVFENNNRDGEHSPTHTVCIGTAEEQPPSRGGGGGDRFRGIATVTHEDETERF
jgi:hypothetical protein